VREAAPLLLLAVLALLAIKPEAAQLGLDLLLPTVLSLDSTDRIVVDRWWLLLCGYRLERRLHLWINGNCCIMN